MALSKSTITGRVPLPTDENLQFAELTFALSGLDTEGASVLPGGVSTRAVLVGSDIPAGFELWQNTAGLRGTHYRVLARWTVKDRDGVREQYADLGIIQVGSDPSYTLADLINNGVPPAIGTFWSAITQAQYDAAIQAAADAQASAAAAALYDGPKVDTFTDLSPLTVVMVPVGELVRVIDIDATYQSVSTGQHFTTAGGLNLKILAGDTGTADVRAFGAKFDGVTDDTAAIQLALDSLLPITWPQGEALVTDSLQLPYGFWFKGAGGAVDYTTAKTRIHFEPTTKRDLFVWKTAPTGYVFAGGFCDGFAVRGFGAGAGYIFNLKNIYGGNLTCNAYAGFDAFALIDRNLNTRYGGTAQGCAVCGSYWINSLGGSSGVSTTTDFDVYVSGAPLGHKLEDFSASGCFINGVVESCGQVLVGARGNSIEFGAYVENVPSVDAAVSVIEWGLTGTSAASDTYLTLLDRNYFGTNAGGTLATFLSVGTVQQVAVLGGKIKRFASFLKTTANTLSVVVDGTSMVGVPLFGKSGDVVDMTKVKILGMSAPTTELTSGSGFTDFALVSPTLRLSPMDRGSATKGQMFLDAWTNKTRSRDLSGNFSLPIGTLETAVDTGWTFGGARLTPGEVVGNSVRGNGRVAFWQSQLHSTDAALSQTLCSTTSGSAVITRSTGTNPFAGFVAGDWVTVSAGYASATQQRRIVSVAAGDVSITLDSAATSTVTNTVTISRSAHNLVPVGQQGYRSGAASPVGSVTPLRIGESYLDTSGAKKWWNATGLTNADWS